MPPFMKRSIDKRFRHIARLLRDAVQRRLSARQVAVQLSEAYSFGYVNQLAAAMSSLDDLESIASSDVRLRRAAYRLAVAIPKIKKGWAMPSVVNSSPPSWHVALVTDFAWEKSDKKPDQLKIAMRLLTGDGASRQVLYPLSRAACRWFYGTLTGFPRRCPYETPLQYVSLHCLLLVGWDSDEYTIDKVGVSKRLRGDNVKLTRSRFRKIAKCPFLRPYDCHHCSIGMNECERAVVTSDTNQIERIGVVRTGGPK